MTRYSAVIAAALVIASAATATGQDIAARVRQVGDGTVRLTFASKPGVCGDGETYVSTRGWSDDDRGRTIFRESRGGGYNITTGSGDWNHNWRDCEEGPVRVALDVDDGQVVEVHTYVGKAWRNGDAAMLVSTRAAVAYLLQVAETNNSRAGKRVLTPIILADSVNPAPDLVRIAKKPGVPRETRKSAIFWAGQIGNAGTTREIATLIDDADREVGKSALFAISQQKNDESARTLIAAARNTGLDTEVRKSAVFWLGQVASDRATAGLKDMLSDENTEVKKSAVFALSQMRTDKSVDALIEIARTSKDREVRKSALFWLGQSNDPKALALFEELLLK
jgi:HEAT repeat protein